MKHGLLNEKNYQIMAKENNGIEGKFVGLTGRTEILLETPASINRGSLLIHYA